MISVIVPVYNSEAYLPALMESIRAQTVSELEILFINDGSSDGSGALLDAFAAEDPRVRVFHKENGGVSSARNLGLDMATGDHITFADSDDTLEPDLYETLLGLMMQYRVKIAHCSYNRISGGVVRPVGNTGKVYVQSRAEALYELTCGSLFMGGCCNKLYARDLFDGIRFDTKLKLSEDELVNFQVFNRVDTIVYQDVCKYNYLDSATSACRNTCSLRKAQDHVEVADRLLRMNQLPELESALGRKKLSTMLEMYKALLREPCRDHTRLKETAKYIRLLQKNGIEISHKQKLMYTLMRICPPAFRLLYGIYDRIRVID